MADAEAGSRRAAVEALLTDLHLSPVTVGEWTRLEPWSVARVRLHGAAAPRGVVVKWARAQPGGTRGEPWRLRTEVSALRFLRDDLGITLAPRVIAADLPAGLVVLEDLAPRRALDRLLRRDGATAHAGRLAAFARALGELGAATAGHAVAYAARRSAPGPVVPAAPNAERLVQLREETSAHGTALGASLTGRADRELTALLEELAEPGPFLALSNGDAEANNVLLHESGPADPRLIDFESAGYAHCLTDAVCLHVPGPGWMSVGDARASGLGDHYRRALSAGVPEAEDDRRYGFGLSAACLCWALVRFRRFPTLDGRAPGDDSRRQLVATLEAAARTAQAHHALPGLSGWVRRTAALLRRRWPDADLDFTDASAFPPYTPRR
jgi:Phosphotransferase enzyme family